MHTCWTRVSIYNQTFTRWHAYVRARAMIHHQIARHLNIRAGMRQFLALNATRLHAYVPDEPCSGARQFLPACIRAETAHVLIPKCPRYACERTHVTFWHQTLPDCMHTSGHASLSGTNIDCTHMSGHASLSSTKYWMHAYEMTRFTF
jgi:hypothetical protein